MIELKSSAAPQQVKVTAPSGRPRSWFVQLGKPFFFEDRFTPTKFEMKQTVGLNGAKKDASELTVRDNLKKNQMVLVKDLPAYFSLVPEAILEWRHNAIEVLRVEEGKIFQKPGGSSAPYRLIKVQEDSAIIAPILPDGSSGMEVVIKEE